MRNRQGRQTVSHKMQKRGGNFQQILETMKRGFTSMRTTLNNAIKNVVAGIGYLAYVDEDNHFVTLDKSDIQWNPEMEGYVVIDPNTQKFVPISTYKFTFFKPSNKSPAASPTRRKVLPRYPRPHKTYEAFNEDPLILEHYWNPHKNTELILRKKCVNKYI